MEDVSKEFPKPGLFRIMGIVSITFWIASIFYTSHEDPVPLGLFILKMGWIAPLAGFSTPQYPWGIVGCFAWYANILFIILVVVLLFGKYPNIWFASLSLGLAATGVLPIPFTDFERGGVHWESLIATVTAWLWLSSFAIIWATALYAKIKTVKQLHL
jgi:hypothetical protein